MPWKSQMDFCAWGKWSVRKPPPFFLLKKPLKPQRLSSLARQVDVAHVVGAVVVLDEAAGPVVGLQHEVVAGIDPAGHGDVGVPAVVHHFVGRGGLAQVDLDEGFRHVVLLAGGMTDGTQTER